jgi:pimeloyl-ACP methyl ester carboxylesterase
LSPVIPSPLEWHINGLKIAGLGWGEPDRTPLLALHGWLDNAASFTVLAPLLEQYYVVALDLTGHGRSDWRSADASYNIWDDLPELIAVVNELGWERFCLMGHSRGAMISCLLASSLPERVDRLVLLDAVMPVPVGEDLFPAQMRRYLENKQHWMQRHNRIYRSVNAAVATRKAGALPEAAVRLLVERNLRSCEGGYTWTTDLRLRGASAVKLSERQVHGVLRALSMPTLLLLAEDGLGKQVEIAAHATASIRQLEIHNIAGGHHFHMEPGAAIVAQQIHRFLQ